MEKNWVDEIGEYVESIKEKSKQSRFQEKVIELFEELEEDTTSYSFRGKLKKLKEIHSGE